MNEKAARQIRYGISLAAMFAAGAYLMAHDCPIAGTIVLFLALVNI